MARRLTMFGPELRRLRLGAGFSLAQLAARVHYSKSHLSKIENGSKVAGTELARACDAVLGADGALAALIGPAPATEPEPEETSSPLADWSLPEVEVSISGVAATAGLDVTLAAFRAWFDDMLRRGRVLSPKLVLPTLHTQVDGLVKLARSVSGVDQRPLLLLAARYAEYAGWMAQEAGQDGRAIQWTNTAVTMARTAQDTDLARYALVRNAEIALYRNDALTTIELAERAHRDASAPARLRGFAAQRMAQGHALAGDYDSCARALEVAENLMDSAAIAAPGGPGGPVLGPHTASYLRGSVAGWCLHDLGRYRDAASILDAEVTKIPIDNPRALARFGARRVLAHAADGEIDHACALTAELLDVATAVDSATVRLDLARLARVFARWHNHPAVREIYPRLMSVMRTDEPLGLMD